MVSDTLTQLTVYKKYLKFNNSKNHYHQKQLNKLEGLQYVESDALPLRTRPYTRHKVRPRPALRHFQRFLQKRYGPTDGPTDGRTNGRTNGWTNGRTNGRTHPLIEIRGASKKELHKLLRESQKGLHPLPMGKN